MTHSVRPIETIYKGFRFRSRLEARWAVFLDNAFSNRWVYEEQGFRLSKDIYYLPDFVVYSDKYPPMFLEIKPLTQLPSLCFEFDQPYSAPINDQLPVEVIQLDLLVKATNAGLGFVVYGDPYAVLAERDTSIEVHTHRGPRAGCLSYWRANDDLIDAAVKSRGARFEHNERWRHQSV
jgi:hypothetical protein